MSKSKKKGTGEARTLAAWLQQLVLQPTQATHFVIAEIVKQLTHLRNDMLNAHLSVREPEWLSQHRRTVAAYLTLLEVLEQLQQGLPPAEIAFPLAMPTPPVPEREALPAEPWLVFGLTATQWQTSIHDVLLRSAVAGSVAASGAISKARIQTVGDFYELWQGADLKIFARIPDFRQGRLRIVKQALMEAKIPWPVWANVSAAKLGNLIKDKPWEDFILTEAQWGTALADILVHDSRGNTYQSVRVRNILAKAGCVTVGELYLFCRGRKKDLLDLKGMSETRLVILDDAMKAAGISPLSQW